MAEKEIKTSNSMISQKDGNEKKALSKKESKPKTPSLPPITQEWTKEAVQYGLKEWFNYLHAQKTPNSEKKPSVERKKEVERLNQLYDWNLFVMSHLRDNSTAEINTFLDWLLELYVDPFRRDVKSYLVSEKMRKILSAAYEHDTATIYPVLEKINKYIPVQEYPSLSFEPTSALIGSIVPKSSSEREFFPPLSDSAIISRLNLFVQNKNADVFTKWVLGILQYNPLAVPSVFDFHENRDSVKKWIHYQLCNNDVARELLTDGLIGGEQLQVLLNDLHNQKLRASSISSLQKENERLNSEYETQKTQIDFLKEQLEARDRAIEQYKELQRKADYEKIVLNEKSNQSEQRLNLQILANERLVADNERRLQKATADVTQAINRAELLEDENQKLSQELENVQADFDLSQNNLKNAEQAVGEQEDRTKKILLRNLVEGLSEPLYYLSGTSQYLAQSHPDDSAIMELPEFLSQINKTLSSMGLTKFGQDGESLAYDPALHELADGMCSKGDAVVVLQCGWKINGDVYKKAIVQKGE